MRRLSRAPLRLLLFALGAFVAAGAARGGTMTFLGLRWSQQAHPSVAIGHEEVRNLDKAGVVTMAQDRYHAWTSQLDAGSLSFDFLDDGDRLYSLDYNGNVIWWQQPPAGICSLARSSLDTSPYTLGKRFERIRSCYTTRLDGSNGCPNSDWLGDYCWYDCRQPHDQVCDAAHTYDAPSVMTHEAGHTAIGLYHYTPCNWIESVMFPYAENDCQWHTSLGFVDQGYTEWSLRDINNDPNEPDNDNLMNAAWIQTGELYDPPGNMLGVDAHLPGYADLDAWRFHITDMPGNEGYQLEFIVFCGDSDLKLRLVIYRELSEIQDLAAAHAGQDLYWSVPPMNGEYQLFVTTADNMGNRGATGSPYSLVVQLYRPVMDAPEVEDAGQRLQVIQGLELVRGSGSGSLELFDVAGRALFRVPVTGNAWRVSLREQNLTSGIYLVRLLTPNGSSRAKLVVLR